MNVYDIVIATLPSSFRCQLLAMELLAMRSIRHHGLLATDSGQLGAGGMDGMIGQAGPWFWWFWLRGWSKMN